MALMIGIDVDHRNHHRNPDVFRVRNLTNIHGSMEVVGCPQLLRQAPISRIFQTSDLPSPGSSALLGPGAGIMGIKSQHVTQRRERAIQAEKAKKLGLQLA